MTTNEIYNTEMERSPSHPWWKAHEREEKAMWKALSQGDDSIKSSSTGAGCCRVYTFTFLNGENLPNFNTVSLNPDIEIRVELSSE